MSGVTTAALEKMFGGIPWQGKGIIKIPGIGNITKNKFGQAVLTRVGESLGEGVEEALDTFMQAHIKQGVYGEKVDYSTLPKEMLQSAAGGAVVGGVLGGAGDAVNGINTARAKKNVSSLIANAHNAAKPVTADPIVNEPIAVNDVVTEPLQGNAVDDVASEAENNRISSPRNLEMFSKEVDGVFNGTRATASEITLGQTPNIYQQFGAEKLSLTIKPSALHKIAYPDGYLGKGKHNLGIPALKQLPKQIENPIAIIKSTSQDNSLVALTEWVDDSGFPVIVPIHLDKKGKVDFSNQIASAYGRKNLDNFLGDHSKNVLWTKENKSIDELLSVRLQLPQAVADDTLISTYNMPQPTPNVNTPQQMPINGAKILNPMQVANLQQNMASTTPPLNRGVIHEGNSKSRTAQTIPSYTIFDDKFKELSSKDKGITTHDSILI